MRKNGLVIAKIQAKEAVPKPKLAVLQGVAMDPWGCEEFQGAARGVTIVCPARCLMNLCHC